MDGSLATVICFVGILGLFYLNRDKSVRTSKALWIPVAWLWIAGSRPLSVWLGIAPMNANQTNLEGSPFDRVVFSILIALGILSLTRRGGRVVSVLRANWPVCLYFLYCLVSVAWSDFPDVSFKRWTKAIGDLIIVLVVVTDPQPVFALKRVFSRVGFVLLPATVLLNKYFGNLSRSYDPFTGAPTITGVTTDKNSLGLITFVLTLVAVWQITELFRSKGQPMRWRHIVAQGTLLLFGLAVLTSLNSATSLACFVVSAALVVAMAHPAFKRPAFTHTFALTLVLGGVFLFLGAESVLFHVLGRNSNFTGRTELWQSLIPLAANRAVGAGFESFWLGPRLSKLQGVFWFMPNEAHNGYIEVYLQLGWVGVGLIALILVAGYRRAVAALNHASVIGRLAFAYIIAAILHNITEAGFRMMDPAWIFLLLMVVSASALAPAVGHDQGLSAMPFSMPLNQLTDRNGFVAPLLGTFGGQRASSRVRTDRSR